MKIVILTAIKEWVLSKFKSGPNVWPEIAAELGIDAQQFHNRDNFSSPERMEKMFNLICEKMLLSRDELKNRFLEFWMTDYAPRLYLQLTKKAKTAKEFIQTITLVNNELVSTFPENQFVSQVAINEVDENTIRAIYANEKSLIDIISILRGVSPHFNNSFSIKKISSHAIDIVFEKLV